MEDLTAVYLVVATFGFAGIGLVARTTWTLVRALESRKWPTIDGEVIASAVVLNESRSISNSERVTTYGTVVRYRYTIDDIEYISKRLSFNSQIQTSFQNLAEDEALSYQPGMKVRVYYDSAKPSEAVLVPGADLRLYPFLLVGFVFIGVALWIYFRSIGF